MRLTTIGIAMATALGCTPPQQGPAAESGARGATGASAATWCEATLTCGCNDYASQDECVDDVRAQASNADAYLGCVSEMDCDGLCSPTPDHPVIQRCVVEVGGPNGDRPHAGGGATGGTGGGVFRYCTRSSECGQLEVCCSQPVGQAYCVSVGVCMDGAGLP